MSPTYPQTVFLNGRWIPADQATLSVFDRGFMLGDGIYEVIPFYQGKPFLLQAHLNRLHYSLQEVAIMTKLVSWEDIVTEAIQHAGLSNADGAVYMQVSRGTAPRTHFFPEQTEPTVLCYAYPLQLAGFEHKRAKVLVLEDKRWHRCDIKSTSLMGNVLANNEAHHRGYQEALLYRGDSLTEGTHTSSFFVKQAHVYTHPQGPQILPGITRMEVIAICKELGIEVKEEPVPLDRLPTMDELFLTGTTTQVLAIGQVDKENETLFRREEVGPITRTIQDAFKQRLNNL
ncbi:aminotransferase class IV [Olivibacter sp. XZL3]|uniref:aminotransferase class IV n=1 Tax=Olivibacter sp. XZL3 TaxID=1735116 RepID=UPI0010660A84|nr:aminotransferase class IV [Olivibacter sp. XZL3]